MVLKYKSQADELDEISEDQEDLLIKLAKKVSDLEAKKNKLKVYYNPGGKLGMPLKANWHLSSPFGYRIHPITGEKKLHTGMDMAVPKARRSTRRNPASSSSPSGGAITATASSSTTAAACGPFTAIFATAASRSRRARTGQARPENRGSRQHGHVDGQHLHFEVRLNEKAVNPAPT